MRLFHFSSVLIVLTAFLLPVSAQKQQNSAIRQIPFNEVHFTDGFWAPRIEINRTVSIPSAFRECEKNGRFDNFALAGGLIKGEHKGDFPFDDTDPYKIIEGASYSLAVKYDKKLDQYLDSVIQLIAAAQEPDGYLTTCVTNKCTRLSGWWGKARWEKINSHELYNSGHLYEAAVAHFQSTGKRTLLNVAIKNADLVCQVFGSAEGQIHRPSGHPIVEMGLAKLYKVTGDKKYLTAAKYFIEETGRGTDGHRLNEYSQDHIPILQQTEIKGHAVRAGYLYSGVADVAALTGDTAYFNALTRIWNNMVSKKLFITGGIGSRAQGEGFGPNYELHNHTAYCETCAAISNVYWNQRMFLATGDSKYIDVLERALYNNVIAGVSLSGDKFFYDNPLESMGQHDRQKWFGCACCPGNITRFMASVPGYMYALKNNELYVNLYAQSTSSFEIEKTMVEIKQTTEYPWDGKINIFVLPEKSVKFSLNLRIPGWAMNKPVPSDLYSYISKDIIPYEVRINGKKFKPRLQKGFISIFRKWKKTDTVELILPMEVQRVKANDSVKDDIGKLAIECGPIVYCIEGIDQDDKHVFNKYITTQAYFRKNFDKNLLNGLVTLSDFGVQICKDEEEEIYIKAIPYYAWNNRGTGEMAVWISCNGLTARPVPEPTIASKAYSPGTYGLNDQWEPASSSDVSKPYHYWWLKKGTEESVEYVFEKSETVSQVQVYWLNYDHYDGNFRVPESWKLQYKDGETWKDVETSENYTTMTDTYNTLRFKPVATSGLKIVAKLQKGESGGILEWKVN